MNDNDVDSVLHDSAFTEWHTQITMNIAQFGHQLIGVFPEDDAPAPGFTYSIGLTHKFGFELFVIGLPFSSAAALLNHIAIALGTGRALEIGVKDNHWANLPVIFAEADHRIHGYVCQADRYYGKEVRVLQILLPDKDGNFIGEAHYDTEYMEPRQPILCTRTQLQLQSR